MSALTVAGAALLAASELRVVARLLAEGQALPPHTGKLCERYARVLEACAAELRDPVTHRACCQAARAADRRRMLRSRP